MLDDLRNSADSSFYEEDPLEQPSVEKPERRYRQGELLGMTASQRFIIALFFFFMVAILGAFLLIVYQKVAIPV